MPRNCEETLFVRFSAFSQQEIFYLPTRTFNQFHKVVRMFIALCLLRKCIAIKMWKDSTTYIDARFHALIHLVTDGEWPNIGWLVYTKSLPASECKKGARFMLLIKRSFFKFCVWTLKKKILKTNKTSRWKNRGFLPTGAHSKYEWWITRKNLVPNYTSGFEQTKTHSLFDSVWKAKLTVKIVYIRGQF